MPDPLLTVVFAPDGVNAGTDAVRLAPLLNSAYKARRKRPAEVCLLLADDKEMQRLNRIWHNTDSPTDVLAFDDGDEENGRIRLGDIAIGLETAQRCAAEFGVPTAIELEFYALHGMLHLLGMDDDTPENRALMHAQQAEAMRDFGITLPECFPLERIPQNT